MKNTVMISHSKVIKKQLITSEILQLVNDETNFSHKLLLTNTQASCEDSG